VALVFEDLDKGIADTLLVVYDQQARHQPANLALEMTLYFAPVLES
jgi:hypothetical protein